MISFAKRNIKLFFRDKTAVFFSLLSVFIIIGLYALFLSKTLNSSINSISDPSLIINPWIMAGILVVISVTTTNAAFGIMISDREHNITKDFFATPIKRFQLVLGYVISAVFIGFVMSLFTLILAEIFIVSTGGNILSAFVMLKAIGIIALSVLCSSSFIFFIDSFLRSQTAFATSATIIGTFVGFLTGMYVPIGSLSPAVQTVIKCFPPTYACSLFRQILMKEPTQTAFANAPSGTVDTFQQHLGVIIYWNGHPVSNLMCVIVLIVTAIIFYGAATINMSRKAR